jgi:hypothetical protein
MTRRWRTRSAVRWMAADAGGGAPLVTGP